MRLKRRSLARARVRARITCARSFYSVAGLALSTMLFVAPAIAAAPCFLSSGGNGSINCTSASGGKIEIVFPDVLSGQTAVIRIPSLIDGVLLGQDSTTTYINSETDIGLNLDTNNNSVSNCVNIGRNGKDGTASQFARICEDGSISILATGDMRFYDLDNSAYTGWRAPDVLSGNFPWKMPNGFGTPGQCWQTDGVGAVILGSCSGVIAPLAVQKDDANIDTAVSAIDFLDPDVPVLVTSSPSGEANVDLSVYARRLGRGGGQTVTGGTAAGENLNLSSTSHATKGKTTFGAAAAVDESNGRFCVGTTTCIDKLHVIADQDPIGLGKAGRTNSIKNGGFEDAITNDWTATDFGIDGSSGTGSQGTNGAYNGSFCGRIDNDGGLMQQVIVTPGNVYTYSARMRVRTQGGGDASQAFLVVGTTQTNRNIADVECPINTYDVTPTVNQWVFCAVTFVAPLATDVISTTVWVGARSNGTGQTAYFDDAMLGVGAIPATYSPLFYPVNTGSPASNPVQIAHPLTLRGNLVVPDGFLVDLSAINQSSTSEGFNIPRAAGAKACANATIAGRLCQDTDGNDIGPWMGDGTRARSLASTRVKAIDYLRCDGVTDDRAALATLVSTGEAAGKTLDMSGCLAMLSNPGTDGSIAIEPAENTVIQCDGSAASGFIAAGKVCVGGTTAGAGCASISDCGTGASSCSFQIGASEFAPTSGSSYTIIGSTKHKYKGIKVLGCSFYLNQSPQWGLCNNGGAEQGRACRSYCINTTSPSSADGQACDADADCTGGTCTGVSTCPGSNPPFGYCVTEGIWPAGHGNIRAIDFQFVRNAVIQGNTFYDVAKSDVLVRTHDISNVAGNFTRLNSGPVRGSIFGNSFLGATTFALQKTFSVGADATVAYNDAHGTVAAIEAGKGSSVRDNLINESAASGIGILATGNETTISENYVTEAGATANGIVAPGSHQSIFENTVFLTGGGNGGAIVVDGSAKVVGNFWQIKGAAAGVYVKGTAFEVNITSNIGDTTGVTWGDHIRLSGNEANITGNDFNGGNCIGQSQIVGDTLAINYSVTGNRCFGPINYGVQLLTGAIVTGNYFAWCSITTCVQVYIGDSGKHITEFCTGSGTPYACCTGADAGTCEAGYGQGTSHFLLTGNLIHNANGNSSLIKFADVGRRCSATSVGSTNDCTGGGGAGLRGNFCPCTANNDCNDADGGGGSTVSCTANTSLNGGTITGNLLLGSSNMVGIDMLLDDDNFGVSTSEGGSPSALTLVETIGITGNTFNFVSGTNVGFNIGGGSAANNITRVSAIGNTFSPLVTTRFAGWLWKMGTKDDTAVARFMGCSADVMTNSGVQYIPVNGMNATTGTENTRNQPTSSAVLFESQCCVDTAPTGSQTWAFQLRKNLANAASYTCTIGTPNKCCAIMPSTTEIPYADGDTWTWQVTPANTPTAARACCQSLTELKGLTPW